MTKKDIVVAPCPVSAGPADKIQVSVVNQIDMLIHLLQGCHIVDLQCLDVAKLCFFEQLLSSKIKVKSTTCTRQKFMTNGRITSYNRSNGNIIKQVKVNKRKIFESTVVDNNYIATKILLLFFAQWGNWIDLIKPISIDLNSEGSTKIPPYRYSEQDQKIIDEVLDDLLQKDQRFRRI